jgi:hypothetical protein
MDEAFDAILHHFDFKVKQQAKAELGCFQVRKQLSFVDRMQLINRLQLENDLSANQ